MHCWISPGKKKGDVGSCWILYHQLDQTLIRGCRSDSSVLSQSLKYLIKPIVQDVGIKQHRHAGSLSPLTSWRANKKQGGSLFIS